ncbi:hypothetical protein JQU17_15190 [Ponticoccus sp. SC2-23]|uniref:hypothetical protein n=1 Tax=Alexandriicola marinus TaxID=2081710 RepID=UPI0013DFE96A|nr:hypothetical protein [Alexandriicola marinus]MBM1221782.1 hypothetical protein [Ponticoccus sp. SC6-9]MBM1226133.1 hypothetical protein [Ponticoccus sp. SC6-15]MBM1230729.1 hypothetical protein [Ponticoccus sp. SC6-38]MBM1235430.1 hypothetical protein [Ponticoccus sp. SC6-45]MBM1239751.1 hypothetical protein [Ponticoccus sp. SC6-49]MBM1243895.1 hypothetical protein [Ponticoccus sp. SC2-64]MBM1248954.1 hypothetical protein [Ponticoccus sp. SC6-42]MBM1253406.1 hypothetical protein [Pontico
MIGHILVSRVPEESCIRDLVGNGNPFHGACDKDHVTVLRRDPQMNLARSHLKRWAIPRTSQPRISYFRQPDVAF